MFPETVKEAGDNYSPAVIANYCFELVKEFNQFYHDHSILGEQNSDKRNFRLILSETVGRVVQKGMGLLGIEVPRQNVKEREYFSLFDRLLRNLNDLMDEESILFIIKF